MTCTFTNFTEQVRRANLTSRDCGNNHWQILGGASRVNFYPSTKRGPRMYVDGSKAGSRRSVTVADAIAAANAPPAKTKGTKRRQLGTDPHRVQYESREQDAGSYETRKGDTMKAEELKFIPWMLRQAITSVERRIGTEDRDILLVSVLRDICGKLDQHVLEMEAAETSPSKCSSCSVELCGHGLSLCPACHEAAQATSPITNSTPADVSPNFRLDAIETRLTETDRWIKSFDRSLRLAANALAGSTSPLADRELS